MTDTPLNTEKDYIPSPERYRNALFSIFYGYTPEQILKHITENIDPRYEDYINSARKNLLSSRDKHALNLTDFIKETLTVCKKMYSEELSFDYKKNNSDKIYSFCIDDDFIKNAVLPDVLCAVLINYLNKQMYKYDTIYNYARRENNKYTKPVDTTTRVQIDTLSEHWLLPFMGIINTKAPTLYSKHVKHIFYSDECIEEYKRIYVQDTAYYGEKYPKANYSNLIPQNSLLLDTLLNSMEGEKVKIRSKNFMFDLREKFYNSTKLYNNYKLLDVYLAERLFKYNFIYHLAKNYNDAIDSGGISLNNHNYIVHIFKEMHGLQIHLGKYILTDIIAPIKEIVSVNNNWCDAFDTSNSYVDTSELIYQLLCYIDNAIYPIMEATLTILLEFECENTVNLLTNYISEDAKLLLSSIDNYFRELETALEPQKPSTRDRKNKKIIFTTLYESQEILFSELNKLNEKYYNNYKHTENKIYLNADDIDNMFIGIQDIKKFDIPIIITNLDGFAYYFKQTSIMDIGKPINWTQKNI